MKTRTINFLFGALGILGLVSVLYLFRTDLHAPIEVARLEAEKIILSRSISEPIAAEIRSAIHEGEDAAEMPPRIVSIRTFGLSMIGFLLCGRLIFLALGKVPHEPKQ